MTVRLVDDPATRAAWFVARLVAGAFVAGGMVGYGLAVAVRAAA